jgi:methylmalonyl-CoA mutase cobalamin-binding subunit
MRDNGIPEARDQDCLNWFAGLAQEALGRLVSVRGQQGVEVQKDHLDEFLELLASDTAVDPAALLDAMLARHLDPEMVACGYASEAARSLGESWLADELSFVDVTIRSERLHSLVRRVDEMLVSSAHPDGPSALILVAEAEQHTLGAFVLALQLRLAGLSAIVKVAPVAADLTVLMAANRFDIALVSIGCTAGLESGVGLVRTLRLLSRGEMRIYVGGAVPLPDDRLLALTGADQVLRDVSALLAQFAPKGAEPMLERKVKRSQREGATSSVTGEQGET